MLCFEWSNWFRAGFVLLVLGVAGTAFCDDRRLELILDADTANKIDDMYAITRMSNQDQFNVLALSSAQWVHYLAEEDSVNASQRENEQLVRLLGRTDLPIS
ncbi:MAG: hypothetical protein AAFP90_08990 [Planctomycetota bacterium]